VLQAAIHGRLYFAALILPRIAIGQEVARRFLVDRIVHAGDGAWVVAARDRLDLDAERALKIAAGRDRAQGRAQRLEAEYRILADLRHPGIPRVVDFGADAETDLTYLVLELIAGAPLSGHDGLTPSHALAMFLDVLRTLVYLHDRQILHFDVKPANLIRDDRRGRTVLIDFDLARRWGGASGRGTAPFVAPEVLGLGGPVDARADLYSLAATFVTLLGGAPPPAEGPAGPQLPAIDHPLIGVLGTMLARDPEARPAEGRAVFARLRELGLDAPDETRASARARVLHPPYLAREALEARVLEEIPAGRGQAGQASVVALKGPPGIGKTRLVDRLRMAWRAAGLRIVEGRVGPGGAGTLEPVRDVLHKLARLDGDGVDPGTRPGADRMGLFDRLGRRLLKLGRAQKTVLVFEDVHRVDGASRDFLVHFFRQLSDDTGSQDGGLLRVLVTYDPAALVEHPLRAWLDAESEGGAAAVFAVEPLLPAEAARLAHQIAHPAALDDQTTASLVAAAGGVPRLLREAVASWIEEGRAGGPPREAGQAGVEALVAARLARLAADERAILTLAAYCPAGLTRAALKLAAEPAAVEGPLASLLMREELAEQAGRVFLPEAFRLQVTASVAPADAAPDHARIAAALERTGAPPDEIAWHLLRAGQTPAALRMAYDAVPALRDAGLEEEAIRLLGEVAARAVRNPGARRWAALTLADLWLARGVTANVRAALSAATERPPGPDPAILVRVARAAFRDGDHAAARRAIGEVLALERELSSDDRIDLLVELAEILHALGHVGDARDALDRAVPLIERLVPHELLSNSDAAVESVRPPRLPWLDESAPRATRYLLVRGDLERSAGRLVAALKCHLAALKIASRLSDRMAIGRASHALGTAFMAAGRHDLAEPWFTRALPVRREAGDLVGVADTANNLGVLMRKANRTTEAIEHFTASLRLRRQAGHVAGEGYAYLNLANVYYERRELDAASRYYNRALLVARRLHDPRGQAQVLNNLGAVAHLRYRLEEALRCYEEAEVLFRLVGDVQGAMARWLNLADLRIVTGELETARRLLDVIARLNRKRGHPEIALRLVLLESRWQRARGGAAEALALLRQAVRRPDVAPDLLEELRADLAFAEIEGGRPGAALDLARTIAEAPVAPEAKALVATIRGLAAASAGEESARAASAELAEAVRFASNGRLAGLKLQASRVLGALSRDLGERPRALNAFFDAFEAFESIVAGFSDPGVRESWLRTRMASDLAADLEAFAGEVAKGRPESAGREPPELYRRLKDALFDVERAIGPIHREAQKRGESIRRILHIARALSSTAPVDELLKQVVDGVIDFSGAERAFIVLVDERGRIRIPVARDREREALANPEHQISRRIVDEVVRRKTSLRFDNAMTEESLISAASVMNLELRSVMCAPLLAGDRVFGLLYVDNRSKTGHFGDVDLDLLDIFAVQVAIALENARLVRDFVRDEKLKVMGNLTGGVAHDFNNLLSAILGRVQDLLARAPDPGVAASLRTIETAAKDGAAIVRRLQDFTRVRKETAFADLEVATLVADVIEFTRSRWEGAMLGSGGRIDVAVDVPAGLFVKGNGPELREVFTNVVLNAVAAMPDGGRLALSATATPQRVTIGVGDSGAGMSEEVREHLFDPYFTTRGKDGMGLGMSIVYGIVARHQGTIRVESRLGEGTQIFVELPRGEGAAAEAGPSRRSRPASRNRRVLVVEDEPGVRAVFRDILGGAGYEVEEAPGGREAIAAFEERGADVVLSDLGMAPMNGWEVAQAVKHRDPSVSVILVTGWGAEIDLEMARRMSVDFLLQKPFDLENLVHHVDEAVELTDSERRRGSAGAQRTR
jgi:signal transduction histidine kinase/tetratricopeptide (TPR) repeat protein/ActR/RegA family two-component response regulator